MEPKELYNTYLAEIEEGKIRAYGPIPLMSELKFHKTHFHLKKQKCNYNYRGECVVWNPGSPLEGTKDHPIRKEAISEIIAKDK